MTTLFVENLTVIDFAFACAERGIVGASWIVDLELEGELDAQGMIFDFGHIKKAIKNAIDADYDHKLWLSDSLPDYRRLDSYSAIEYRWRSNGKHYSHCSPSSAVLALSGVISRDIMADYIAAKLSANMPKNVHNISLVLRDEALNTAHYCYTHGLQKHDGNCQRIAHGHRSKLEIFVNGLRDHHREQAWAERWSDIYIATRDHIVSDDGDTTTLYYTAPQGEFRLSLPSSKVYIIDTDSTVENIAAHLKQTISAELPTATVKVKAFEGVGKGAISG